jgi:BirA family biotin operon repressor/biotin-[acetyl-CoA-carboxylase] ligase
LSGAPNPVSLKQLTGKTYTLEELAEKVTDSIFLWYKKLRSGQSEVINTTYISHLFRRGEWSVFREQNRTFEARIVGIGEFGQLLTEDRSGKITGYMFKEVEFVI